MSSVLTGMHVYILEMSFHELLLPWKPILKMKILSLRGKKTHRIIQLSQKCPYLFLINLKQRLAVGYY